MVGLLCILPGCQGTPQPAAEPTIEFTKLPPAGQGSPDKLNPIEGRVRGARPGQRLVLFARAGLWWVQPTADKPFTKIQADSSWKSFTHPGSAYAALLVGAGYHPPTTAETLPKRGGAIAAIATVDSSKLAHPAVKTIAFSGYQWEVRQDASDRGGTRNSYDPANVWTDKNGFLHLRIAKHGEEWTCAEVNLAVSLGYGSYRFVVSDISRLEPAAVFSIFTWDEGGPPREVDIEVSRWGETASKNAQYVIQPYYVPANVIRFMAPAGLLTHSFVWEPGRLSFKTERGAAPGGRPEVADHTFTSGVPSPGGESVHINLYVYANQSNPLRHGAEVIVEKFEYLP